MTMPRINRATRAISRAASAIDGMISESGPVRPRLGSQRSCTDSTAISIMPSQKFGTASSVATLLEIARSGQRCWNDAAAMPAGIPMMIVNTIAVAVSSKVAGTRSMIRGSGLPRKVGE